MRLLEEASAAFLRAADAAVAIGGTLEAPGEVSVDFLNGVATCSAEFASQLETLRSWAEDHLVRLGVTGARGCARCTTTPGRFCPSPVQTAETGHHPGFSQACGRPRRTVRRARRLRRGRRMRRVTRRR